MWLFCAHLSPNFQMVICSCLKFFLCRPGQYFLRNWNFPLCFSGLILHNINILVCMWRSWVLDIFNSHRWCSLYFSIFTFIFIFVATTPCFIFDFFNTISGNKYLFLNFSQQFCVVAIHSIKNTHFALAGLLIKVILLLGNSLTQMKGKLHYR